MPNYKKMINEALTSLDELISNQFGKISQKAYEKLGWNKYDCSQFAQTIGDLSFGAMGIYQCLQSYLSHDIIIGGFGIGEIVMGYSLYNSSKPFHEAKEHAELELITRTGAGIPPEFGYWRPLTLINSLAMTGMGINMLTSDENKWKALGLVVIAASFAFDFTMFAEYFRNQPMTPPKTKKNLWKSLYETLSQPLQLPGKLEPAKERPQPHQIIDDTMAYTTSSPALLPAESE